MNKTQAFLCRIGLRDTPVSVDIDFLNKIQYGCVCTIPYENTHIINKKPISLDADDIYEKIITNHRGGYCFELNALLHHMLCDMGFCVKSRFARFLRGEAQIPFRRHRVVIVCLDGKDYFLDIGIGQQAPRFPLEICVEKEQRQGSEVYKFRKDQRLGLVLCDLCDGKWRDYISFTDEEQFDVDFVPASFWCEKHADSPFNKSFMLAIKTENGRKTIQNNSFKIFENEELVHLEENLTNAELESICKKHFKISLYD